MYNKWLPSRKDMTYACRMIKAHIDVAMQCNSNDIVIAICAGSKKHDGRNKSCLNPPTERFVKTVLCLSHNFHIQRFQLKAPHVMGQIQCGIVILSLHVFCKLLCILDICSFQQCYTHQKGLFFTAMSMFKKLRIAQGKNHIFSVLNQSCSGTNLYFCFRLSNMNRSKNSLS